MKFTSNIGKEELLSVYSQALADAEKKMMIAILGLGINPDTFEMTDIPSIEESLIESDVEGRDKVEVVKRLASLIEIVNEKIANL